MTINRETRLVRKQASNQVSIKRLRGIKTRPRLLILKYRVNKTQPIKEIKDPKWKVKNLILMPKILKM